MKEIIKKIDEVIENKNYDYISKELVEIYYYLGKYLYDNNKNLYEVEEILRNKYGLMIGFTRRNLNNMYNFYNIYKDDDIKKLKNIEWDIHLIIMKKDNKKELINYCLNNIINKNNLKKIIKYGFDKKYIDKIKNKEDNMTLEIIEFNSRN